MNGRLLLPVLLIAVLAAGCGSGGGSTTLGPEDVAVVDGQHILKAQFDELMAEAKANLKSQGRAFPKAGTTNYAAIKSQAVTLLVQNAQAASAATKLGIIITAKQIETRLNEIKKQYFGASEAKYQAAIKKQGLTEKQVRDNIKSQLTSQKLFEALTKDVTVTPLALATYYAQHASEYQTPASRAVRYILVGKNKSSLAKTLDSQLTGAPDPTWCTLVKKYSQDVTSKPNCGKMTFRKGQTVAQFEKAVFSLRTKQVAVVNTTQYGWFVVQPTAAITPGKKTPVATVSKQIKAQLLKDKKNAFMTDWSSKTQKSYCKGGKIKYQTGYAPSPDPCAATNTTSTTTTK